MSSIVKNIGAFNMRLGSIDSKKEVFHGHGGSVDRTVRLTLRGIEYVWGPNESKTLPDDIAAEAVSASNNRLRIADSRDGIAWGGGTGVS